MAILTVGAGAGFQFQTLSSAIAASADGDVIQVQPGTYTNDFATISTRITIIGIGGMVNLVATVPPPNQKAILTTQTDVTLDNIAFSGAAVSDAAGGNAAGIRYEGGNLVINNCYFHDNQNGLLGGADLNGTIIINNCEFASNGNVSGPNAGRTHNLYVGDIAQLTISNSYFHDAVTGHDIKSRARNTTIENSRITAATGTTSYEIDLPNGGNAIIRNNVIEKGPNAGNPYFIAYGEEGSVYGGSSLSITGNTVLNDKTSGSATFLNNATTLSAEVDGNTFYGLTADSLASGPTDPSGQNTFLARASEPALNTAPPYIPYATLACFVRGTLIETPTGAVAVEQLTAGDPIMAMDPATGRMTAQTVRWVGFRRIDTARHPEPARVMPIRVACGAIADHVPRRDLLMSPDHAILLDDVLVPVRLLVNGTSIRRSHASTVHYFHVELDLHGIIMAEGVPAETYLDTGNRDIFENAATVVRLHGDLGDQGAKAQRLRQDLSCVALAIDPNRIRPIWQRLADRAGTLGFVRSIVAMTTDPALRLDVDGHICLPASAADGRYVFMLPRRRDVVHIVSRSATPNEVTPWIEDQRRLGVPIGAIIFRGGQHVTTLAPDAPCLVAGWWDAECDNGEIRRWTKGRALLPVPPDVVAVELRLAGTTLYPREGEVDVRMSLRRPMAV
ncbi:MAG: Hint domain-containing protein [Proteobacteria bacterium]|nr:Hint domain-containing protein [Pseudomonadota bacterium]